MLSEKVDIPNLNKSLNKRRHAMPQVASWNVDHFLKWLKDEHGIRHTRKMETPSKLIPTQKEFNHDKIEGIAKKPSSRVFKKPILVTKKGYILDGHHRWAAAHLLGRKIMAVQLKDDIDDIIEKIKSYNRSFTKRVHEMLVEDSVEAKDIISIKVVPPSSSSMTNLAKKELNKSESTTERKRPMKRFKTYLKEQHELTEAIEDFMRAASQAKKEGKKKFKFGDKEYPVTISKDDAQKIIKSDKESDGGPDDYKESEETKDDEKSDNKDGKKKGKTKVTVNPSFADDDS